LFILVIPPNIGVEGNWLFIQLILSYAPYRILYRRRLCIAR
jgi:hypothetical protein